MKYCHYFLVTLLAVFIAGCGTTVQESLKVAPLAKTMKGRDKSLVVLPFADYSYADNLETAYRRNLFITENLTDQFARHSFHMPVQEDVFKYLVNQNIINVVSYGDRKSKSLEYELQNDWSESMKRELRRHIDMTQRNGSSGSVTDSPGTHGLTPQEIVKIGRHFSADYIIRGRIIQYKDRLDPSWAPWKRGIIGFVTGVSSQIAFGQADSNQYDEWGNVTAGAAYGAWIGDGANWPYDGSSDQNIFGIADGGMGNTVIWGAIGAGMGQIAHNSGKVPQAVVQLRIWVQDAYTGNVVWTNRVDVKVSPQSVLADYQYDALFEAATEKAIITLIDDFAKTL